MLVQILALWPNLYQHETRRIPRKVQRGTTPSPWRLSPTLLRHQESPLPPTRLENDNSLGHGGRVVMSLQQRACGKRHKGGNLKRIFYADYCPHPILIELENP